MPDLIVFPDSEFPENYKCQVLTFLRVVFWEGFVGENHLRDWITRPEHHPLHFVLVEGGLVISHTEVVWKNLEHARQVYKIYGLTGVLTFPSFRKQGYGEQIVLAASEYITHSDADVGMFHCSADLRHFYSKCGWIPMETARTYIGAREQPVLASELMMMKFLSEKGKRGRMDFETIPVFFDEDSTW